MRQPDQSPAENRQIIGTRWVVVGERVEGGMASVVPAFDLAGEFGQVALKLLPAATNDRWRRAAFENEQEAIARLAHPNIVRLLEVGRDEATGQRYLVFPWYRKRLHDRLRERGALTWERWWEDYGGPILRALELIHRQDVIHRDLKPANILLDGDDRPIIIDFGIAKLERRLAPEEPPGGESRPFTPPEPDTPAKYMATRDVHAWAALTVFAVSGADPHPGDDRSDDRVLCDALVAARERLPARMVSIIGRCLAVEPADRPATAGVLLTEVETAHAADAQAEATRRRGDAPVVHLRLTRRSREALELERDLYSAEVDDLVTDDLGDECAVLPYAGDPDQYIVVGTELSLHVAVDDDAERFAVINAAVVPDSALERDRLRGWPGPVRFSVRPVADHAAAQDAVGYLRREVAAHDAQRRADERRQRTARPLTVWRTLLGLLRSLEIAREDPLPYRDARVTHRGGVAFAVSRRVGSELLGQRRAAPADGDRGFVGDVVSVDRSNAVVLRAVSGDPRDVLPTGQLRVDTHAATAAIERQQRSLDAVQYGRARRADLARLVTEPGSVAVPRPILGLTFMVGLDEPKQRAVESALGSDDLMLVQGPPGTGKTTFIAELVLQALRRNPDTRVLLSSQGHSALDNALVELHRRDPSMRLLRVARTDDDRVDPEVGGMLLERNLEDWKREVVQLGNAWLRRWAGQAGVVVSDVEGAMRLRELGAHLDRAGSLRVRLAEAEQHVEELRAAARRAAPTATAPTLLRDRAAEIEEVREAITSAEAGARDELARLVELELVPFGTRLRELSSDDVRRRAADLLPGDHDAARRCEQLIGLLADWHARFGMGPAFQAAALLRSQVVAATCVGLGGIRGAHGVPFDLCIVDEASRATATELLIPMALSKSIVLVGDEKQLPPYVDEAVTRPALLEQHGLQREDVTTPLFARLASELPVDNVVPLTHQHRMNPAIGRLVSDCFYDGALTSEPRDPMTIFDTIAPRPVSWLTTSHLPDRSDRRYGQSFANDLEARVIRSFLGEANALAAAGKTRVKVAVLAGYGAQRDVLERRLEAEIPGWAALDVELQTVDAYQGRQADVVLYSMTRSNVSGDVGFLREKPRLNVALSRARDVIVIVGDHLFAREAPRAQAMRRVIDHIEAWPTECCIEEARDR
ncbi:MAG TPA: AAA domain-containing protein [Solirubrobacteraceae bacterium]